MIEINVNGRIVSVQETEPLYMGAVDVQNCHFTFDRSWDKFSKTAVFRVDHETHTKLLDENDCCVLPWELLTRKNIGKQFEVGMYGVSSDTKIMTSVWDSMGMIREGSRPGSDARNPVDGIYEQIMSKLQRIYEAMGICDEGIQAAVQRAETAAKIASDGAMAAAQTFEALKEFLLNGAGSGQPIIPDSPNSPYCLEYGTLAYNANDTQEMVFNFSQSYEGEPMFIPYVDNGALKLTVTALRSGTGYYGGKVTVTNTSEENIAATIAVAACCSHPVGEESEGA